MKKVLIVEDHDEARRMLTLALEKAGFEVMQTGLATSALRIVREHAPDAVLLDARLSDGPDGFQVCERIKASPASKNTFVMLISGLDDVASFERARRCGANAFLVKPFRLSRLIGILSNTQKWAHTFLIDKQP